MNTPIIDRLKTALVVIDLQRSALSAEEHSHTVKNIFPRIGLVRTTGEILAGLA